MNFFPFSLNITDPFPLLLLLLLPLVFLLAWKGGSLVVIRSRFRRLLSIGLRLSIVSLIVLALAGLRLVVPTSSLSTIFLLDMSGSMEAASQAQALNFTRQAMLGLQENQQAGVIVFGQDARVEKLVSKDNVLGNIVNTPDASFSNLAEAVRLGLALLPSGTQQKLILVSDGNQNAGEVRDAAKVAAANGVEIDVVVVKHQASPEASISRLQLPTSLRQGEEFDLKVAIESNYTGPAKLQILQDGKVISDKEVTLETGSNLFSEPVTAKDKGPVNYSARLTPSKDTLAENNQAEAYSVIKEGPKVLLVEGHPAEKEAASLQAALKVTGITAEIVPPDRLPASVDALAAFDATLLVNVPANSLQPGDLRNLQTYVKDRGKGLIMVGGEESFGLGNYTGTPIEEMLPVELQLPARLQRPSVAMVLVLDRSYSMTEPYLKTYGSAPTAASKLELAKDAAYQAVTQLTASDQVGVVTFDTQARWQVQITKVGDPTQFKEPIGRIAPGGGTDIFSGFNMALEGLQETKAASKHIIILTDGQDSIRSNNYNTLVEQANQAGITVSTIGLGADVNSALLADLAERSGGRYNFVNDASNLPKVFVKEVRLASRNYVVEESFVPALSDPSVILKQITATPALKGYVATKAKPTATVALVTGRKEPLLAHWQYGLGRVAAWTSDATGRWALDWLSWPDFPRFWSQLVRWTVPENVNEGLQVQTRPVGNRIYIAADAINTDNQFLNGLELTATVTTGGQSGAKEDLRLVQTAPGHYEGYFVPKNAGSFVVDVAQGDAATAGTTPARASGELKESIGVAALYPPEFKQLDSNDLLLKEIAAMTGGKVLTDPRQAFDNEQHRSFQALELAPWMLLAAVLLFPLDIAVRMVRLSPAYFIRYYRNRNRLEIPPAVVTSPPTPAEEAKAPAEITSESVEALEPAQTLSQPQDQEQEAESDSENLAVEGNLEENTTLYSEAKDPPGRPD